MQIELSVHYQVKVIRFVRCGCIVSLPDKSTQLIHVSQISPLFVSEPSDFVTIGEVYDAVGVPGTDRPVQLSLKHLNLSKLSPRDFAMRQDSMNESLNIMQGYYNKDKDIDAESRTAHTHHRKEHSTRAVSEYCEYPIDKQRRKEKYDRSKRRRRDDIIDN